MTPVHFERLHTKVTSLRTEVTSLRKKLLHSVQKLLHSVQKLLRSMQEISDFFYCGELLVLMLELDNTNS